MSVGEGNSDSESAALVAHLPGVLPKRLRLFCFLLHLVALGHGSGGPALTWGQSQTTGTFQLSFHNNGSLNLNTFSQGKCFENAEVVEPAF